MTGWWRDLPAARVSLITGADRDAILTALDPLPPGAPPVIAYRPPGDEPDLVGALLAELERVAVGLYPAWLPGAEHIAGPQGAGVPAVRALATDAARRRRQFGPFLADLAEQSLSDGNLVSGYAPVVRAAGFGRVIADSFDRPYAVLLIDVPDGLPAAGLHQIATAAQWLAEHSSLGVWLTGSDLSTVDRFVTVPVDLGAPPRPAMPPAVSVSPLAGRPRADSPAELALEAALDRQEWARGRSWNQTYHPQALAVPFRLDLWWPVERVVVEVDGPEHYAPIKYAADRRRDAQLQLDGHAVLRYTNEQVLSDHQRVVSEIKRLVGGRRPEHTESSDERTQPEPDRGARDHDGAGP